MKQITLTVIAVLTLIALASTAYAGEVEPEAWVFYQNDTIGTLHVYREGSPHEQTVFENVSIRNACHEKGRVLNWQVVSYSHQDEMTPVILAVLQGGEAPDTLPHDFVEFLHQFSHLHYNAFCTYLPTVIR